MERFVLRFERAGAGGHELVLEALVRPLLKSCGAKSIQFKDKHGAFVESTPERRGAVLCVVSFGHPGEVFNEELPNRSGQEVDGWVSLVAAVTPGENKPT